MTRGGTGSPARGWRGIVVAAGISAVLGGLAALVWQASATLPTYTIAEDGSASTTERGLTEVFSTDATFSAIGLLLGVVVGAACTWWFAVRGALVVAVSAGCSLVSGLVCWWVGVLLGPGQFDVRVAGAKPGDTVPIDFQLHSPVALVTWLLGAGLGVGVTSLVQLRRRSSAVRGSHDDGAGASPEAEEAHQDRGDDQ